MSKALEGHERAQVDVARRDAALDEGRAGRERQRRLGDVPPRHNTGTIPAASDVRQGLGGAIGDGYCEHLRFCLRGRSWRVPPMIRRPRCDVYSTTM